MKYGYCDDCMNKGCCNQCYRGSHYESAEAYNYNNRYNSNVECDYG